MKNNKNPLIVSTYVYSAWHNSSYRASLGDKWTEWELLGKWGETKIDEHDSDLPLWGFYDDTDPKLVSKQIKTAKEYGINNFVYTFYWDKLSIFNEGLENGFFKADNNEDINFCIMISPRLPRISLPLPKEQLDDHERIKREIKFDENNYKKLIDYCSDNFFSKQNYLKIDNKPVVYFFQYYTFNDEPDFAFINNYIKKKGFEGIYPIAVCDYLQKLNRIKNKGYESLTSYNLLADYYEGQPIQDYKELIYSKIDTWEKMEEKSGLSYFPSVSLGFNASSRGETGVVAPKCLSGSRYYPWYPQVINFNLKAFSYAISKALKFAYKKETKVINVACWNEWTEGCCLEPGEKSGFSRLKALKAALSENCLRSE